MGLQMSYGQTRLQFNWKATDDIVFVKQVANLDQNQGVFVNFHITLYNFVYCVKIIIVAYYDFLLLYRAKHPVKVHVWAGIS